MGFHLQNLFSLALRKARDGYARPFGGYYRDILLADRGLAFGAGGLPVLAGFFDVCLGLFLGVAQFGGFFVLLLGDGRVLLLGNAR